MKVSSSSSLFLAGLAISSSSSSLAAPAVNTADLSSLADSVHQHDRRQLSPVVCSLTGLPLVGGLVGSVLSIAGIKCSAKAMEMPTISNDQLQNEIDQVTSALANLPGATSLPVSVPAPVAIPSALSSAVPIPTSVVKRGILVAPPNSPSIPLSVPSIPSPAIPSVSLNAIPVNTSLPVSSSMPSLP